MIAQDSLSANARGGTELMKERLQTVVNPSTLDKFQIFFSRVEEPLDNSKIRILYCHDLPGDPASNVLINDGWKNFHKIVFVSNWQMQAYINYYNIPWSRCTVIKNAIEPIPPHVKPKDGPIRLAYWSTPHRGLELLLPVFKAIHQNRPNVVLDVYSSFKLYGWEQRDADYKRLFDECEAHPNINYHGTVSNEDLRLKLLDTHIMAYPNIWPETSCLCLIEAMSAGVACVHPNFAGLYETGMNQTFMYQYDENPSNHANLFASFVDTVIENYWSDEVQMALTQQKFVADKTYNLQRFSIAWNYVLSQLLLELESGNLNLSSEEFFIYKP